MHAFEDFSINQKYTVMAKKKEIDLQNTLAEMIDWEDLKKSIAAIDSPISKVNAYLGLLPYVLPKLQSVSQDIKTETKDAVGKLLEAMSIEKDN